MVNPTSTIPEPISLAQFLTLPMGGAIADRAELIEGKIIPKMAPQRFHSKTQRAILRILEDWGEDRGEIGVEWSVVLQRQGEDWVPIPDALYVGSDRLPPRPLEDEPCPVPPDLVVEIISPGQRFGDMAAKAMDYLISGVLRVWVIDPRAQTITVFHPDAMAITYRGDTPLTDPLFPGLTLTPTQLFQKAGLQ